MLPLNDLAREIHNNAIKHKWWEDKRNFGEVLMLIVTEVAEAMEEWRRHHAFAEVYYSHQDCVQTNPNLAGVDHQLLPTCKPEGVPIEMADVIIRVLDACAAYEIDITKAMAIKTDFNLTRPERLGGKRA